MPILKRCVQDAMLVYRGWKPRRLSTPTSSPQHATVVDVGGGNGMLPRAASATSPQRSGILFDQPRRRRPGGAAVCCRGCWISRPVGWRRLLYDNPCRRGTPTSSRACSTTGTTRRQVEWFTSTSWRPDLIFEPYTAFLRQPYRRRRLLGV
jgi:hypothetical protein